MRRRKTARAAKIIASGIDAPKILFLYLQRKTREKHTKSSKKKNTSESAQYIPKSTVNLSRQPTEPLSLPLGLNTSIQMLTYFRAFFRSQCCSSAIYFYERKAASARLRPRERERERKMKGRSQTHKDIKITARCSSSSVK